MDQKEFNATPEGQRAMFYAADSTGTALYINRVVKSKGGTGWDDKMIETANPVRLRAENIEQAQLLACHIEKRTREQINFWRVVPTARQIAKTKSLLRGI